MKVQVSPCWSGGEKYHFRLEWTKNGKYYRENIRGEYWDRETAKAALDMLQNDYGYNRRNIRFS